MNTCTVNGAAYEATTGHETWGQLLAALEKDDGSGQTIVTAVRFEGVDEPSFREAPALARAISHGVPREVGACTALELIASAIQVAFDASQDWIAVADVLEYEIAERLPRWTALLHAMCDEPAAPCAIPAAVAGAGSVS
jgi:hypothetical protein